ncbi:hypothetical protein E2C01_028227 [Portunus trituberculatus]|uniref:Uncharacterized protein n=1 Tax=Portunus trituberculatus TaxID=210409 RepID=A0A5B7EN26_PORTR|nr:hypothetical protein [Portunus trituberculatus]
METISHQFCYNLKVHKQSIGSSTTLGGRCHRAAHMLHRKDSSPLLGQLGTGLSVAVVHGEVGHDDRHWERNCQYTSQGTERTHKHAHISLGSHVAIAHSGHGDQCPPQAKRDAVEVVVQTVQHSQCLLCVSMLQGHCRIEVGNTTIGILRCA